MFNPLDVRGTLLCDVSASKIVAAAGGESLLSVTLHWIWTLLICPYLAQYGHILRLNMDNIFAQAWTQKFGLSKVSSPSQYQKKKTV